MPALSSITIKGFKSIAAIERLELRPINVLIGPNGSGKSNFIGAFAFLHAIREGRLQEYVARAGGADRVLHFGSKTTPQMELAIDFEDGVNGYGIALASTTKDQLFAKAEMVSFWDKKRFKQPYEEKLQAGGPEASISQGVGYRISRYVRTHLDRWRVYHFHDTSSTSPMKKTAELNDNHFLRQDGSNLAAFLYLLKTKYQTSYQLIRKAVQRVAPFFEDFQLEPLRLNASKIQLEWRHKGTDAYFDASMLSDGTLRFIALATLLLQPDRFRPSVVLVDEPELGLHPFAITQLASLVRAASLETQVILSTQSPHLLDHFEPEDVLVADRVGGGTQLRRLDSAALAGWLEDYSLGQLWEKNEIGGRPGTE